jgi:hypothetical protein
VAVDVALGPRFCHHAFDHGFGALQPSGANEVGDDAGLRATGLLGVQDEAAVEQLGGRDVRCRRVGWSERGGRGQHQPLSRRVSEKGGGDPPDLQRLLAAHAQVHPDAVGQLRLEPQAKLSIAVAELVEHAADDLGGLGPALALGEGGGELQRRLRPLCRILHQGGRLVHAVGAAG